MEFSDYTLELFKYVCKCHMINDAYGGDVIPDVIIQTELPSAKVLLCYISLKNTFKQKF